MRSQLEMVSGSKEKIQHKINTGFRVFLNRMHTDYPPHWHTDMEIIWAMDAPYKVVCHDRTYMVEVGDILIICPAVLHEIFSISPGDRLYIQADFSGVISLKELDKAFRLMSPALHISKKSCPPQVYEKICGYFDKIKELYFGAIAFGPEGREVMEDSVISYTELEPYGEVEIYSILMEFISFCAKNIDLFRPEAPTVLTGGGRSISLSEVCAYISEHFTEDISLDDISGFAGFSKYHFERIFSEYTGLTFYRYLQQMRIHHAQTLLSNPALSITDIAYQAGFASCTAFTRAFKKSTGYPPSRFRMLNEEQHPLSANPYFADT